MFTHPNLLLQLEDPCKYLILEELNKFWRNFCGKFLKLEEVSKVDRITDTDTADQKHSPDILVGMLTKNPDILVGMLTKNLIKRLLNEGDISQESYNKFFKAVRSIFAVHSNMVNANYP